MSESDTSRPRVNIDDKLSAEIEAALGDMSLAAALVFVANCKARLKQ